MSTSTSSSNPLEREATLRKQFEECKQHKDAGLSTDIRSFEIALRNLPEEKRSAYSEAELADKFVRGLKTPYFSAFAEAYLSKLTENADSPCETLQDAEDAASDAEMRTNACGTKLNRSDPTPA
jgi:hypothetical protein